MNRELTEKILTFLIDKGIRSFCLCPGGRCAPFVEILSAAETKLEVLYFFEERSAGFFALGRVRRDLRPVALVTTSGTAVAEILPAVIESHYSGLPLVLLTADRPAIQRKQGAPQTLKNPLATFKDYTACHLELSVKDLPFLSWDLKNSSRPFFKTTNLQDSSPKKSLRNNTSLILLKEWSPEKGSLHINVSFDEPLTDGLPATLKTPPASDSQRISIYPQLDKSPDFQKDVESFFHRSKKPLVLVGELKKQELPFVEELLKEYKGLLYTEALSCLGFLKNRLISGEKILAQALKTQAIDGVIRLGGIPRVRFWRDLEKIKLPVFHLSSPPFYSGLSYSSFNHPLKRESLKSLLTFISYKGDSLKTFDREQSEKWEAILKSFPESEPHWIWVLRNSFKENSAVFLGNSLPIRLWDMVTLSCRKRFQISGQGGVNGIDGLISRFFGECHSKRSHTAIVGDLSALYDFAGFWNMKKRENWKVFVINNFGGQIFSRLYSNKRFLNKHHLSFKPVAEMWGLDYELHTDSLNFSKSQAKSLKLIEIRPEIQKTKKCFRAYDSLWDT